MPADQSTAEFLQIEQGRMIDTTAEVDEESGFRAEPVLQIECSNGAVALVGRINLGEGPRPIIGRICVDAAVAGSVALPLRCKVSIQRRSDGDYEIIGTSTLDGRGTPSLFPARLEAGPKGHVRANGDIQFKLTIAGDQAAGRFMVVIRAVTFEWETAGDLPSNLSVSH